MARRNKEDHVRYAELIELTRDDEGVCHGDIAEKQLAEELAKDTARIADFAADRAGKVADMFDKAHAPETEGGQMRLDIDTYLVLGDNERVKIDRAKSKHTRQWLDIQTVNHSRVSASWAARDMHGRRLLVVQDEHACTMWNAERHLRGELTEDDLRALADLRQKHGCSEHDAERILRGEITPDDLTR
jgi:hypothetical protein